MIVEIASIRIDPNKSGAFERAVAQSAELFRQAEGCHSMALERVTEVAGEYRLVVGWETRDHHMLIFRQSPAFATWRSLAGPYFLESPHVEHWERAAFFF